MVHVVDSLNKHATRTASWVIDTFTGALPICVARGVATDLEIQAEEIAKSKKKLIKLIAEETGKSEAQVEKDCDRDHWLTAEEALEYGLVSKILSKRSDLSA